MVNAQKKFQKKKDRERKVKSKIMQRREQFRAQTKEQERTDREASANDPKRKPICSAQERRQKEIRDAEIRRQLLHNIQVLKTLEAQYDKDNGKPIDPGTITLCESPKGVSLRQDIDQQILKDLKTNAEKASE